LTDDLIAMIRTAVAQSLRLLRFPQKAIVSTYDPAAHMAKVKLQPQGTETGWLQIGSKGAGSGIGSTFGLSTGDEVMVSFEGGDINSGVITGVLFNGQVKPVRTLPGEYKVVSIGQAHFKMFANGDVELMTPGTFRVIAGAIDLKSSAYTNSTEGLQTHNFVTSISYGLALPGDTSFHPDIHEAIEQAED
jgi:phage baseplate assembly protein gpV